MFVFYRSYLHLFDDSGSGSASGDDAGAVTGDLSDSDVLTNDKNSSRNPEREKDRYNKTANKVKSKSVGKSLNNVVQASDAQTADVNSMQPSYSDLIRSDQYKAEHKAYMEKTISDRLKKYRDQEANYSKMKDSFEVIANKYGVDPNSNTFLQDVADAIGKDSSYYEDYAIEHGISTKQAREILSAKKALAKIDQQKQQMARENEMKKQISLLYSNAEKTKAQYPSFDLALEMRNEAFRNFCAVSNGNTTQAFIALHYDDIMRGTIANAAKLIANQQANAIASNFRRPVENGVSSKASAIISQSFKGMDINDLRKYAEQKRRLIMG